jgi:hypothetical protein
VGAEEREATMLAQYVNVSFTLWVWSSSVVSHSCVSNWACMECIHVCSCTLKNCIEGLLSLTCQLTVNCSCRKVFYSIFWGSGLLFIPNFFSMFLSKHHQSENFLIVISFRS